MKNKNFFILPNEIFEVRMLPSAFFIFCFLVRSKNKDGRCFPSIQTISKAVNISKSTVCSSLKWLEENKFIETHHVFKHGRQTNNEYIIKDLFAEDYKPIEHYPHPPPEIKRKHNIDIYVDDDTEISKPRKEYEI